jgi:uncharacterized membrane protein
VRIRFNTEYWQVVAFVLAFGVAWKLTQDALSFAGLGWMGATIGAWAITVGLPLVFALHAQLRPYEQYWPATRLAFKIWESRNYEWLREVREREEEARLLRESRTAARTSGMTLYLEDGQSINEDFVAINVDEARRFDETKIEVNREILERRRTLDSELAREFPKWKPHADRVGKRFENLDQATATAWFPFVIHPGRT